MNALRSLSVVLFGVLVSCDHVLADPGTPKLWVQTPGLTNDDAAMLVALVQSDTRVDPILHRDIRWDVNAAGTAADIFRQAQAISANGVMRDIAIQLAGFGTGGIDNLPSYVNAPAICRPPSVSQTMNDRTLSSFKPWETPWFDFGPGDCHDWLVAFRDAYRALVNDQFPGGDCRFEPVRFIFDMENEPSDCWDSRVNTITLPAMLGFTGGFNKYPAFFWATRRGIQGRDIPR